MTHSPHPSESPFHDGEREIQERYGVRGELEARARKVVRAYLPDQHRRFYEELPFVVVAALDDASRPWATLLAGAPGFIRSPDATSLRIAGRASPADALAEAFLPGSDIGLLGIDLSRRRRNRVNGRVRSDASCDIVLDVAQSFGNCPRFIALRDWRPASAARQAESPARAQALTRSQRDAVARSETFFIASGHRGRGDAAHFGLDASHRGGPSGFVEVEKDGRSLAFPDYPGNNHFNTFGNLIREPRCGLVFVDFAAGSLLQLTGRADIEWQAPHPDRFPGAERLVRFAIEEVVEQPGVLPIRWARRDGSGSDGSASRDASAA